MKLLLVCSSTLKEIDNKGFPTGRLKYNPIFSIEKKKSNHVDIQSGELYIRNTIYVFRPIWLLIVIYVTSGLEALLHKECGDCHDQFVERVAAPTRVV